MKILLAGPGTGKTTNIKSIINEKPDPSSILVISFTNATVNDLKKSLLPIGVPENNCMTLHKFAVKYNHDRSRHVLHSKETDELEYISKGTEIEFNSLCDFLSCTTFNQMISRFVGYAKSNQTYLQEKLANYATLIVDEYQDFNKNEQELIDLITEIIPEVYILGDDDQCIYDFKDASSDKIIELYNDGSHEKIAHENICYRCPDVVIDKATTLIKNNAGRVNKEWKKNGKDGDLFIKQFSTNTESATYILNEIQKILPSLNESILLLSPVGFFIDDVTKQLDNAEIDYTNHFIGKVPEELVMTSWSLKVLFGEYKYLNLVLLGYVSLSSRSKFYELLKSHYDNGKDFNELYELLKGKLSDDVKVAYPNIKEAFAIRFFSQLAYLYEQAEGTTENEKLENLFIVIEEQDEKRINIMSIHKSKGLGADHVFMMGLVEGILPNKAKGNDTIESQRRLFYVGMTRAKKSLHMLSSINLEGKFVKRVNQEDFRFDRDNHIWKGKASRFIQEIN